MGSKGCGEGGTIGPAPVLAAAVEDALSPFGIVIDRTPITPSLITEQILAAAGRRTP
jgi:carbon-monoxide dehydrogenase large subunit